MLRQYLICLFVSLLVVGSFAESELTDYSRGNTEENISGPPQSVIQDKFSSQSADNKMATSGDLAAVIPGSIAGVITNESTDFIENCFYIHQQINYT